jgi:hypothetical protein
VTSEQRLHVRERCQRCGGRGWLRQVTVGIDLAASEPVCRCEAVDCPACRPEQRPAP